MDNLKKLKDIKKEKIICYDVETTGLDFENDEILQLSIIDGNGNPLFDNYIKPKHKTSWDDAEAIHKISPEMVANEKNIDCYQEELQQIFDNAELIVGYNQLYFDNTFIRHANININQNTEQFDVMLEFAEIYGEWSDYRQSYKWQKLTTCAGYYGYDWGKETAHNSLADTNATLFCFNKVLNTLLSITTQKGIKYSYEIINDNEVRILKADVGEATEIELSDLEVDGKSYAVTEIGESAFMNCRSLKGATFPKVTTIDDSAFMNCRSLNEANFPKATEIGESAFQFCKSLEEVSFPEATELGESAFALCYNLKQATFPRATTTGDYAFYSCESLEGATFPKATEIGESAFKYCDNLEELVTPKVEQEVASEEQQQAKSLSQQPISI